METRRTSQETSGGQDQPARLTRLTTSRTKLEEASKDGSAHSTQGRFPGVTISDELLQMIEKMSNKTRQGEGPSPQREHDSDGGEETQEVQQGEDHHQSTSAKIPRLSDKVKNIAKACVWS